MQASTNAPPPKPANDGATKDIVVTAQKRSENMRKVLLSVSVISGAQIQGAHNENYADLSRAVPNLSSSTAADEMLVWMSGRLGGRRAGQRRLSCCRFGGHAV